MTRKTDTEPVRDSLTELRKILDERFSEGELRTLCFDLGMDYDTLPGQGKADKARELLSYLERRKRIPELVQVGERVRPDISWADTLHPSPSPSIKREVGCIGRIGSRIIGLRMCYDKLPAAHQVAVIGVVGTIVVALITLCGTLGVPVVGGVVERWLARPTEVATLTFTPTSTVTPTPTHTPLPTPMPTLMPTVAPTLMPTVAPTLMPTVTPTITPTPTPDCRDVQVSCLELVLVDSPDQQTIQICPDQNDQNVEIAIARSQIDGLMNLKGQAILTGTNVADCTCDWEGKTNEDSSMHSINSPTGKCAFSIDLPDQVTVINLMLTIGEGSGPIRSFKVRVQ